MPGSTMKACISCKQHIRVACKICKLCGAQQPMKKSIIMAKNKVTKEWGEKMKKGGNLGKLFDAARILIHKFKMAGLHPLLLYGQSKKNTVSCGKLCGLDLVTETEERSIQSIHSLYETILKVIIKRETGVAALSPVDPQGQRDPAEPPLHPEAVDGAFTTEEDGTVILTLTPCDPVPATSTSSSFGHPRPCTSSPPPMTKPLTPKLCSSLKQTDPVPAPNIVSQTHPVPTPLPSASPHPPRLCSALKQTGRRKRPKPVNTADCEFHSAMENFPYSRIVSRRTRNGIREVKVKWVPCPQCHLRWADSWVKQDDLNSMSKTSL